MVVTEYIKEMKSNEIFGQIVESENEKGLAINNEKDELGENKRM